MLHFVICDDEAAMRKQLAEYSHALAKELGEEIVLYEFSDGLDLLEHFPQQVDIVFLDIRMQHIDGLETALRIRQINREVCLIFITNMLQYALDCYKVHAYSFLPKPLRYQEFRTETLDAIHRFSGLTAQFITIEDPSSDISRQLNTADILYLEVLDHKVTFHLTQNCFSLRRNLKDLEQQLAPYGFLRCHMSYLVNARLIRSIEKSEVIMQNGDHVPISKQRRKSFAEEFTRYAGGLL